MGTEENKTVENEGNIKRGESLLVAARRLREFGPSDHSAYVALTVVAVSILALATYVILAFTTRGGLLWWPFVVALVGMIAAGYRVAAHQRKSRNVPGHEDLDLVGKVLSFLVALATVIALVPFLGTISSALSGGR